MQEEFKVFDTVYYAGPEIEGRSHPEFGESCMVQRINGDSITAVSTHFILEVSKEHLSKTPPAKEKSSADIAADNIRKAFSVLNNRLRPIDEQQEYKNPTALILRQIADQIEFGSKRLISMTIENETEDRESKGQISHHLTGHTNCTFEIVDNTGGDCE
jgi:hypothetical protein